MLGQKRVRVAPPDPEGIPFSEQKLTIAMAVDMLDEARQAEIKHRKKLESIVQVLEEVQKHTKSKNLVRATESLRAELDIPIVAPIHASALTSPGIIDSPDNPADNATSST